MNDIELFQEGSPHATVARQLKAVEAEIARIDAAALDDDQIAEIARQLDSRFTVHVAQLRPIEETEIEAATPGQVDARFLPEQFAIRDSSKPHWVQGTHQRVIFYFDGDSETLHWNPGVLGPSHPIAETVADDHITVVLMTYRPLSPERLQAEVRTLYGELRQWLRYVESAGNAGSVFYEAKRMLEARRDLARSSRATIEQAGFRVRKPRE